MNASGTIAPPASAGRPIRRSTARHEAEIQIELDGALDLASSLEMFRRSGDDLLDRWNGTTFIRTLTIDGRAVAFAIALAAAQERASRPRLSLTVEDREYIEPVVDAVRATFVPPTREFAALRRADRIIARLAARYRGFRPVLQLDLLGALVRCISAQQVNLRWAAETRRRLAERFGDRHTVGGATVYSLSAERLSNTSVAEIRALQFTNRKAEYIIAVAQAAASRRVTLERLSALGDDEVIADLVALRGIGAWTAEWILARSMGRPRVVAGDLGVRKAVGIAYAGGSIPSLDAVRTLTAHWGRGATHAQALLLHALGEKHLEGLAAGR